MLSYVPPDLLPPSSLEARSRLSVVVATTNPQAAPPTKANHDQSAVHVSFPTPSASTSAATPSSPPSSIHLPTHAPSSTSFGPRRKAKHHLSRISITEFYLKRRNSIAGGLQPILPLSIVLAEFMPLSSELLRLVLEYVNGSGRLIVFAGHTYSAENELRLNVDFCDRM